MECAYTSATAISTVPKGEYLKKGAACAPCRSVFSMFLRASMPPHDYHI